MFKWTDKPQIWSNGHISLALSYKHTISLLHLDYAMTFSKTLATFCYKLCHPPGTDSCSNGSLRRLLGVCKGLHSVFVV